jgi:hypothetical protein
MKFLAAAVALIGLLVVTAPGVPGCDLCGCYTPQLETLPPDPGSFDQPSTRSSPLFSSRFYVAAAEQFTHFGTLQLDGEEIANPTGQYLDSSNTQLVAGYSINARLALQFNLPLIYRSFKRPVGFAIERGTESGLGDVSLLAKYVLFRIEKGGSAHLDFSDPKSPHMKTTEPDFTASAVLTAGVKFPTGDTDRLKEEFNEMEIPGAPPSGIHGHDLALGAGSFDGIFGGQAALRYHNFFFQADAQFAWRGDGEHQYDFANDISWSGGPGYYFTRTHRAIVGLQFVVSGEHKDLDRFRSEPVEDTGITSVFLGPRIVASVGKVSAELGVDIPVLIDNTSLQTVPDYRIRGGIALRF